MGLKYDVPLLLAVAIVHNDAVLHLTIITLVGHEDQLPLHVLPETKSLPLLYSMSRISTSYPISLCGWLTLFFHRVVRGIEVAQQHNLS